MAPSVAKATHAAPRPADVNNHVGSLLRIMHDSVLDEPVPDRFLELLRQMEGQIEALHGATPAAKD